MADDEFKPRLGRMRASRGGRAPRYLGQVLKAVALAGGRAGKSKARFQGNRIGRGAGVGRVLRSRDRFAAYRARRVIIKTRIVKLGGDGLARAARHLSYLQRDGVTREGEPGDLYDATRDHADGRTFLAQAEGDRHQFRIIVSAEDGEAYEDLRGVTRRLLQQMESDLNTKLDWVAVDHFNTGHPHTHIVLRGRDDEGKDLIIARDYLSHGMRERAAEIVLFDLGPKSDTEIERQLRREVEQERFTSIDRALLHGRNADGLVPASAGRDAVIGQSARAGRLQKLRRLGLAEERRPGIWHLSDDLEPTLRRMGERGDIIKTLHRALRETERVPRDCAIFDPTDPAQAAVVGQIVERGLADELRDRHYLVVDSVDGRTHYADIGSPVGADDLTHGAVVRLTPSTRGAQEVDRTVVAIAQQHAGRYNAALHRQHDPAASAAFVESHIRRLEAMRRAKAGVERESDGTWRIAPNHLDRAAHYQQTLAERTPLRLEVLSSLSIAALPHHDGPTWLDRELEQARMPRDHGFGHDVREALRQRRQWLIAQQLGVQRDERFEFKPGAREQLRQRELRRLGTQLASDLGLAYVDAPARGTIHGVYRQSIQTASGRMAVIARSRDFSLAPWRPALEQQIGKPVTGLIRGSGISWSFGRQRSGPSV